MNLLLFTELSTGSQIIFLTIIALCIGSFASLISYRLAEDGPLFFTSSKCPSCNHNLKIKNLFPVFSWLWQKGKCEFCKAKILIRYPLIEITFGVIFLIIYFANNKTIDEKMLLLCAISTVMMIMIIMDLEHYFIANSLQYIFAILATLLNLRLIGVTQTLYSFLPAFIYAGSALILLAGFLLVTKKEAIGIDDIKFLFIAGFMLGTNKFFTFLLLTGLSGTLFGLMWKKFKHEEIFPFAPAICFANFVCMLCDRKMNPIDFIAKKIARLVFS